MPQECLIRADCMKPAQAMEIDGGCAAYITRKRRPRGGAFYFGYPLANIRINLPPLGGNCWMGSNKKIRKNHVSASDREDAICG